MLHGEMVGLTVGAGGALLEEDPTLGLAVADRDRVEVGEDDEIAGAMFGFGWRCNIGRASDVNDDAGGRGRGGGSGGSVQLGSGLAGLWDWFAGERIGGRVVKGWGGSGGSARGIIVWEGGVVFDSGEETVLRKCVGVCGSSLIGNNCGGWWLWRRRSWSR